MGARHEQLLQLQDEDVEAVKHLREELGANGQEEQEVAGHAPLQAGLGRSAEEKTVELR